MSGIACAGNWVLDRSKFINHYPDITGHTTVDKVVTCAGGAALNILMAFARLEIDIPTYGIGLIGKGMRAKELQQLCFENHVNTDYVKLVDGQSSFTDAFTLPDGSRTQFHCPGVNNLFQASDVPLKELAEKQAKLFYLGHIMILEGMDASDKEYGTVSARLFHDAQALGMETVVDVVSNPSLSYENLVLPILKHTDHLIINEFEAEQISGIKTRDETILIDSVKQAAKKIMALGVKKTVVIHMPEGAFALKNNGDEFYQASLSIPSEKIIASCGAGDAFCAGILYGIHENWGLQKSLLLGICTAGASLMHSNNSDGILPLEKTLALAKTLRPSTAK